MTNCVAEGLLVTS